MVDWFQPPSMRFGDRTGVFISVVLPTWAGGGILHTYGEMKTYGKLLA